MPASDRPVAPSDRSASATTQPWIVLVHEGSVQQTFAPELHEEGLRAAAESPMPLTAYEVLDQVPPPVPGSKVDPVAWGWTLLAADAGR